MLSLAALTFALCLENTYAQGTPPPNSFPHDYPGKPSGDFSPEWQDCMSFSKYLQSISVETSCRLSCDGSAQCNNSSESKLGWQYSSESSQPPERYSILLGL